MDRFAVGDFCDYGHADYHYDCHGENHVEYFLGMPAEVAKVLDDQDHASESAQVTFSVR